jgi:hypothetical protein
MPFNPFNQQYFADGSSSIAYKVAAERLSEFGAVLWPGSLLAESLKIETFETGLTPICDGLRQFETLAWAFRTPVFRGETVCEARFDAL